MKRIFHSRIFPLLGWIAILASAPPAFADSSCPYLPSSANVLNLAISTESLLRSLEDSKDQCGQAFTDAVKSVNSLGSLLTKLDDAALSQRAERDVILQELAKCSARDCTTMTMNGMPYDTYLAERAQTLENQIATLEKERKLQTQQTSQKDAVALTSNLMSAVKNAAKNDKCRDHLANHYAGPIAQTGLGMLSVASPLLFSSGTAVSVGLISSLVSDLVDFLNSLPPKALQDFEKGRKTLEMACLYHAIMSTSCEMRDNLLRPADFDTAKRRLESQAQCIQHRALYNEYANAEKLLSEIGKVTLAITVVDSDSVVDAGKSGSSNDWARLFNQMNGSSGEAKLRETLQMMDQVYPKLKACVIDNPSCAGSLDAEQRDQFENVLNQFVMLCQNYRFWPPDRPVEWIRNGQQVPYVEIFKTNHQTFYESFQKRKNEVMGSGGDQDYRSLNSLGRIHTQVPLAQIQSKVRYLNGFLERLNRLNPADFSASPQEWNNLKASIQSSQQLLSELVNWTNLNRASFPDETKFKEALSAQSARIRQIVSARATGQTDRAMEVAIEEITRDPLVKLQALWRAPDPGTIDTSANASDPFADPFEEPKGLTPFERFSLLREVHGNLKNSLFEANDQYYLGMTRRLFENSALGESLVDGIEAMIERKSKDPDPEVSEHMIRELCGLTASMGAQKTVDQKRKHPIAACAKLLPKAMSTSKDECSYVKYYQEKIREDQARFGRTLRLPTPAQSAQ
ncbi:MAG: hypothetical protein A2X94_00180 [Bdellovibrionales bacterium GWB1_55_8]|nr:MAG: hypothetical protein A2X94_00180 [Bdellovibrionales bacterium GWB1_55_8]